MRKISEILLSASHVQTFSVFSLKGSSYDAKSENHCLGCLVLRAAQVFSMFSSESPWVAGLESHHRTLEMGTHI